MKRMQTQISRTANRVMERERHGWGTATLERLRQPDCFGEDGYETTKPSREAPGGTQRVNTAPLDRMWKAGTITAADFNAGDMLRRDAFIAKINPGAPTVDWASLGSNFGPRNPSMFSAQSIADARIRWRRYDDTVKGLIRSILDLALINEMALRDLGASLFARKDPREAAVAAEAGLRVALGALRWHYGG